MNNSEFIVGDEYIYKGTVDSRTYTYASKSSRKSVGIFTNCSGTIYYLKYENMTPCKQTEPQYPNPPLPHCEERIAFCRGVNIEFLYDDPQWVFDQDPKWYLDGGYRVKVEKTKDELRIEELERIIAEDRRIIDKHKKELAELKNKIEE